MARFDDVRYRPVPENHRLYDRLYDEYRTLHDYFGGGGNDVMKALKRIRTEAVTGLGGPSSEGRDVETQATAGLEAGTAR